MLEAALIEELRTRLRGPLLTAEHADYEQARQVWNGMIDRRPALIARCSGTADVVAAVNFARTHDLLVSVRGGGHNVAGSAVCDGGLMIDLSSMKGIYVDPQKRTAHTQGGATWGDLDRETQLHGLATPGGVVSTTGIAGLTLGGGLGWLRNKYGLSCDNLLSVEIVTADGQVRTASAVEHADLFWGLRGGGGNFGVVTSFEFQLHPVGPDVATCLVLYPAERTRELMAVWRDFVATAPDEFGSVAFMMRVPAHPALPQELHGEAVFSIQGAYCGSGDPAEGERVIRPLRELGAPLLDMSGILPYTVLQSMPDTFWPPHRRYYFTSVDLRGLDDEVIAALADHAAACPFAGPFVNVWHYGRGVRRVAPEATAFASRATPFLLEISSPWADADEATRGIQWCRELRDDMRRFSGGGMYGNFGGLGDETQDTAPRAYGANYARLAQVKTKYDPQNLFHMNQNIVPAHAGNDGETSAVKAAAV
jgi:FAD/FMN-containing dehydrogenase